MGRACCTPSVAPWETPQCCGATDNSLPPSSDIADGRPDNAPALSAENLSLSSPSCCEENPGTPKALVPDVCCGGNSAEADPNDTINNSGPCRSSLNADIGYNKKSHSDAPGSSCCSPRTPTPTPSEETDLPECCRGKSSPCCNDSCLDRLALRECDASSDCLQSQVDREQCPSAWTGEHDNTRQACDRHQHSVRKQYAAKLTALQCICRSLIALGRESCCEPRARSSLEKQKGPKKSTRQSVSRDSTGSCSTSGSIRSFSPVGSIPQSLKSRRKSSTSDPVKDKCSTKPCCRPKNANISGTTAKARTSKDSPSRHELISRAGNTCGGGGGGGGACCTSEKGLPCHSQNIVPAARIVDLESQASGFEHVVLAISGMTCTGCETKLSRTLAAFTGVKNLRTSLVLSRAEFDLDLGLSTVERVAKYLERTTEFKCEVITKNGSTLDVLVLEDTATFVNRPWPQGVAEISSADGRVVRIAFEPELIGARDLIENHWSGVAKLAPVNSDQALAAGNRHVRHVGLMTILSAALTIPVLVLAWAPVHVGEVASGSASLALATLVQFLIAGPFYPKALKALVFSRVIEMDLLIVLSTSVAYIFSLVSFGFSVAGNPLSTGQFFETSTLLVTLIMVGRYVSALARQKAVESISIRSLQTLKAIITDNSNSPETREIDARLLQYGDLFKVPPDSRIPTDGTVLSGFSEVDESMVTGESRPIEKHAKSNIIAGTINGSGTLVARVTRLPGNNTISTIAAMVDEAKLSKPKLQELADRVSSYFVPVILALTIITFVVWIAVGMAKQGKSGSEAVVQAITYAITVLIVSCPCAIGLAVPMVVVIVSGIASKSGVIFKSASAIEVAYKTSHVILDKTGTLTQGKLSVAVEHYNEHSRDQLSLLLGLISDSKHPVSVAVKNHLKEHGVLATAVPGAINVTGCGVESELSGQCLKAGNVRWLDLSQHSLVQPVLSQGYTTFCFTIDGALCAVFGLEDLLRDSAEHLVSNLHKRGVSVHVVSGDDKGPVDKVATKLGITESNVHARSSPGDKQTYIKKLLDEFTNTKPVVIFCGDGANDAVALAQATIGIHINEGSDIAQSAADIVLLRPDLSGILTVIDASKASVQRIKFNFGWSFVYNTFAVLLAAGAFVTVRIPPEFAGLGELVSVLPVITAAVLLRWSQI